MEVSTQYNTITYNDIQTDFRAASTVKAAEVEEKENFQTAAEMKQAELKEKVMMDLKDVQNFLYMLIGSEIKVSEQDNVPGTALDMSA